LAASTTLGCPYSIRDTAYLDTEHVVDYTLFFVVDDATNDVDVLTDNVAMAHEAWLLESNVEAKVVLAGDQQAHRLREALPGGLENQGPAPIAVLLSPKNTALVLGGADSEGSSLDAVMAKVVEAVESPARLEALDNLIDSWCVILLIEGTDAKENERAAGVVRAASERITGTVTEMDRVVETGPHMIRIAHKDPQERVVLWSLGLADAGKDDGARVAMLVGKGELRGPVLAGKDLTEKKLFDALEMLGRNCTCTTDQMWTAGPRAPLAWGAEMQQLVEFNLGFDPDSPEALDLLKGALAGGVGSLGNTNAGIGYHETIFDVESESDADGADDATPAKSEKQVALATMNDALAAGANVSREASAARLPTATVPPAPKRSPMLPLLLLIGAVALFLVVMTVLVFRRTKTA